MYNGEIIQEHGQKKGDDLLASVRIIGRYSLVYSFTLSVLWNQINWCKAMYGHFINPLNDIVLISCQGIFLSNLLM